MFDAAQFLLGIIGALVTVYLSRTIDVPEFRAFFDTSRHEQALKDLDAALSATQKRTGRLEDRLEKGGSTAKRGEELQRLLDTLQREIDRDIRERNSIEAVVRRGQIASRTLGMLVYVALGGVFGDLLAEQVDIEGVGGNVQSLVIGSAWAGYISTIAPLAEKLALPRLGGTAESRTS
jgi:hypothetical protein